MSPASTRPKAPQPPRWHRTFVALGCLVALQAMAQRAPVPADLGPVQNALPARVQSLGSFNAVPPLVDAVTPEQQAWVQAEVAKRLASPLDAQTAVEIALLNHRGLQAAFARLGVAEADWRQAGLLANPKITIARFTRGDEVEWEWGVHLGLARWVMRPWLQAVQSQRLEQARLAVAQQVLSVALDARKAWIQAVAAEASVRYAQQVMDAAEASAELARRMAQVGNFSRLQQAREHSFYADAALQRTRAEQARLMARERLTRQLGLWGDQTGFTLPSRLPDLPAAPVAEPDLEAGALQQRLDIAVARAEVHALTQQLQLTGRARWIQGLEVGGQYSRSNEDVPQRGGELGWELPLFDSGTVRLQRDAGLLRQAQLRAEELAIQARSEIRETQGLLHLAWDLARHQRDEVVPLRTRISEENLLRYNGMFIGVFELLADARAQIASVQAALDTLRDYWLAQAERDAARIGRPLAALGASAGMPPGLAGTPGPMPASGPHGPAEAGKPAH